jgi:hypothetical protein
MVLPATAAPVITGTDCMIAYHLAYSQIDVKKCILNPTLRTIEVDIVDSTSIIAGYADATTYTLII